MHPYTQEITSFTDQREWPWVTLGENVSGTMNLEEAMAIANLDNWNVRSEKIITVDSGIVPPHAYATVRDTDDGPAFLGMVGKRYKVWQNEEAFAPVQDILDTSELEMSTAGFRNEGQQVFISMKVPEGILVGGEDRHDVFLLARTSHDGSTAVGFDVVCGRLACYNSLRPLLANAVSSWSMRHTGDMDYKVEEARRSLSLTFNYMDEFNAEISKWLDDYVVDEEFDFVVNKIAPVNEDSTPGRVAKQKERQFLLWSLFKDSPTNEFGRGTKYAAYNALTEYADHYLPVRGADPDGTKRANRAMSDGIVSKFKDRAFNLVAAL